MFPVMGSYQATGGSEFPFIIFSLAVLAQVGFEMAGAVCPSPFSLFVVVEQDEWDLRITSELKK